LTSIAFFAIVIFNENKARIQIQDLLAMGKENFG